MATMKNNGSVEDDAYSEDSGSTQESELDFNMTIDVVTPDNKIRKITFPANTPWGDVKAKVCSHLKLSPSSHTIDYISSTPFDVMKQRTASRPIGKMDVTMMRIQNVTTNLKADLTRPPAVSSVKENTVRLLVKLSKVHQHVVRVSPDVPLSSVFNTLCDKLKYNENEKDRMELRHPIRTEVVLNLDLSLNHYKLREVLLTEKKATFPAKTKRKAPAPPPPVRPKPQSRPTANGCMRSSPVEMDNTKTPPKPKPKQRRVAPTPQKDDLILTTGDRKAIDERSIDVVTEKIEEPASSISRTETPSDLDTVPLQASKVADVELPRRPPRVLDSLKDSTGDDDDVRVTRNVDLKHGTKDTGDIPDDVRKEVETSNEEAANDDSMPRHVFLESEEMAAYEATSTASMSSQPETALEPPEDVLAALNDVLEQYDDFTVQSDVVSKRSDEEALVNKVEDEVVGREEMVVGGVSGGMKTGDTTVNDVSDDDNIAAHQQTKLHTDSHEEEAAEKDYDVPLRREDEEPSVHDPPSKTKDAAEIQLDDDVEVVNVREASSSIQPASNDVTCKESEVFPSMEDCHVDVDENLKNTATKSTDNASGKLVKPKDDRPGEGKEPSKIVPTPTPADKKDVELSESEKTALEIEKLHLKIKRMREHSSAKPATNKASRRSWHPGSRSFTFIPNKDPQTSHDDYDVTPVGGIKLSNSGEIERFDEESGAQANLQAVKRRTTLPSYYEKFLRR